jgi:SAM-dependent methyltransferase
MNLLNKIRGRLWLLSTTGLSKGPHITRYSMYRHLRQIGTGLPIKEGDVLSISHSKNFCELLGVTPTRLTEANFPEHNILDLEFEDNSFDFVFADQVLEHVEGSPQQAMDESWRVLKPGGIVVHTTCLMMTVHGAPHDYWRFTPYGLEHLAKKFTRIIDCGGWGNLDVWRLDRLGLRYVGIPHASWHPLHKMATQNDPQWPVVTWLVSQK